MKFKNWTVFLTLIVVAAVIGCSAKNSANNQTNPSVPDSNPQAGAVAGLAPAPVIPKFDAIAKNADGTFQLMSQTAAVDFCEHKKMHLPTVRELALLATSEGAAGISASMADQPDLTHIQAKEPADTFYFDASGYKPATPPGVESVWLWSSSLTHETTGDYAYYFSVNMGVLAEDIPTETHEVRCVISTNQ
jgi:hypothetical protein